VEGARERGMENGSCKEGSKRERKKNGVRKREGIEKRLGEKER